MKYNILYADPPWQWKAYYKKGLGRAPQRHYRCMSLKQICNLKVKHIAAKNSILFLWATHPMLKSAFEVIKAWGFTYKTVGFVWIKKCRRQDKFFTGLGYWTRANAEMCLLATRGHPKRIRKDIHSIVCTHIERHSKKPDIVRNRIVKLMGDLPRIELFARQKTLGWHVFGNEVKSDVKL